jgi:hypothetical protein
MDEALPPPLKQLGPPMPASAEGDTGSVVAAQELLRPVSRERRNVEAALMT